MTGSSTGLRIGALGVGRFGRFALDNFCKNEGTSVVAIGATFGPDAPAAAEHFDAPNVGDTASLVAREDVELVYVATPPDGHHPNAVAALKAGKHVICEKPLCLTVDQADEVIEIASTSHLLVVADLMQRYNRLYQMVKDLIDRRLLGAVVHARFENHASDQHLPPDHWFWDPARSGGIFVEHGVHFFDMFDGWLGPGRVVTAQRATRAGTELVEQVGCTVRHDSGVLVDHYHGFTQPDVLEHQELVIEFEMGRLTLYGWIPTGLHLQAAVDDVATEEVAGIFPAARIRARPFSSQQGSFTSRHTKRNATLMIQLDWTIGLTKYGLYGDLLRDFFEDQASYITDPTHARKVTAANGRDSLVMAVAATAQAT
jgi:predicted dehydrogenase